MRTPKFSITQDEEFVHVTIKVPHIRVAAAELIAEDCSFSFYCQPYLLKLSFPCPFKEEDEECRATYDPFDDNGTLIAYLPKREKGQHFPDLDLTTKLMTARKVDMDGKQDIPSIEVIDSKDIDLSEDMNIDDDEVTCDLPDAWITNKACTYGFNNQYSRVFANLRDELLDMMEIRHPDSIMPQFRTVLRIAAENAAFDAERYLGDLSEAESDAIYQEAMGFQPFYAKQWDEWKSKKAKPTSPVPDPSDPTGFAATSPPETPASLHPRDQAFEAIGGFTEAERELLSSKLPRKEYLVTPSSPQEFALLLGLADLLFAFCYDHRVAGGETNVESAHTVARLSCTLSWLEDYSCLLRRVRGSENAGPGSDLDEGAVREEAVRQALLYSLRRSVIYPYLRLWKLSRRVLTDVAKVLFLGKRAILKCLLQLYAIFENTDTHYLLNKVYVADYCVWLQSDSLTEEALQSFAKAYNGAKGKVEKQPREGKELMGFCLPELERWAQEGDESGGGSAEGEDESAEGSGSDSGRDNESDSGSGSGTEDSAESSANSEKTGSDGSEEHGAVARAGEDSVRLIPDKYLDYAALQAKEPQLAYLHSAQLSSTDPAPGPAEDAQEAVNRMLLLPKRKAELTALGDADVAAVAKRPLIEEISSSTAVEDRVDPAVAAVEVDLSKLTVSSDHNP